MYRYAHIYTDTYRYTLYTLYKTVFIQNSGNTSNMLLTFKLSLLQRQKLSHFKALQDLQTPPKQQVCM